MEGEVESELWLPACLKLGPGACQGTFSIKTVSLIPLRAEIASSVRYLLTMFKGHTGKGSVL